MFVFRKIWCALFTCNTSFLIHPLAILLTIYEVFLLQYVIRIIKRWKFHHYRSYQSQPAWELLFLQ